jgi:hypothetical protein
VISYKVIKLRTGPQEISVQLDLRSLPFHPSLFLSSCLAAGIKLTVIGAAGENYIQIILKAADWHRFGIKNPWAISSAVMGEDGISECQLGIVPRIKWKRRFLRFGVLKPI